MQRIVELETKANQNSKNSHLPPSKDKHLIKIKAAQERRKGGKTGGQYGHEGSTLEKSEYIDETILLKKQKCTCGKNLQNVPTTLVETRQVFELPKIELRITEYQKMVSQCPCCGQLNHGVFPEGIESPTQYGQRLRAFCTMLNVEYKLPLNKIQAITGDLLGIFINESTIYNGNKAAYKYLTKTEEQVKEKLLASPIINVDETGAESGKKLEWAHVISNWQCTYIYIHEQRGGEAILNDSSFLIKYTGRMVHDCFSTYFKLTRSAHSTCGSHLLRELEAQNENKRKWSVNMQKLLLALKDQSQWHNKKNKTGIYKQYERILDQGKKEEPPPERSGSRGRLKKSKGLNLIERMLGYKQYVLAYAFDKNIPFTNNQAERDLRHIKIKLKISGCFRSELGTRIYARISSFISTLKKNKMNILENLTSLFQNREFRFNWA